MRTRALVFVLFGLSMIFFWGSLIKTPSVEPGLDEMMGHFDERVPDVLHVDLAAVPREYAEFKEKLHAFGNEREVGRTLYSKYIPLIGANGVLAGITEVWPTCHNAAHNAGRLIYSETTDIDTSLRICQNSCYSGCMHGVFMEAYAAARDVNDPEGHVNSETVRSMMQEVCAIRAIKESYSPGDCAHATGHALIVLAEYDIDETITWCDTFADVHMRYYCATGAYMQYVTQNDQRDTAAEKPIIYPCESHRYPAACARYKMWYVVQRLFENSADVERIASICLRLSGYYRIGCFHGMGNAFMFNIVKKKVTLDAVCRADAESRAACIDGAIERMAKYNRHDADATCASMTGNDRILCAAAKERGMYDMAKDLRPYLH